MDNENYNAQGQLDIITTELFDLQGADTPLLLFDLAKVQYSASFNDGLRVQVSSDCGSTYTEVYL